MKGEIKIKFNFIETVFSRVLYSDLFSELKELFNRF